MRGLESLPGWVPVALALLSGSLVLVVLGRALLANSNSGSRAAVRRRLSEAVARGSDASRPTEERARAFVDAGRAALEGLGQPRLAARHATYAHALAPSDRDVVLFLVDAMRRAQRHVGLERALWVTLDRTTDDAVFAIARSALVELYAGPLRRPERARVLGGLRRAPQERKA